MAVNLLITALLGVVALTLWRATRREARGRATHPPTGQMVVVNGLRVHVDVAGTGPDLILIHGASGNLRDFTFALRDQLTPHYRTFSIDRPGLGHSDPLPGASLESQARHMAAAVALLGASQPILLGQSYGGAVSLAWALQGAVSALVLVGAPSLPWPGPLDKVYNVAAHPVGATLLAAYVPQAYVEKSIKGIFAPATVPAGYDAHIGTDLTLRRSALQANGRQVSQLRPQLVAMEPRYVGLTLPVELIHGDKDTIVPLAIHSAPLATILPNVALTVINGAGHMPHHSHAELVIAAIHRAAARAGLR